MSKPIPASYQMTNWLAYNTALTSRGSLLIWFDPGTEWLTAPGSRSERSAAFSDAAIQTCVMLKALFGLALRQTTRLVASFLTLAGPSHVRRRTTRSWFTKAPRVSAMNG